MPRFSLQSLVWFSLMVVPAGQAPAAQRLGAPATRWTNDFSRIGGVAELPDGRVVIVDNRDGLLFLGATTGGTAAQLGRTGEGPNEYRRPFSVFHGLADTVLVYSLNRLMRVSPQGVIVGSHPFSSATLGSVAPPRGVDREGNVYWERVVVRVPGSEAIKRQQQYQIVRYHPRSSATTIVAHASDHAPELHHGRFYPFAQRDAWLLEPDGTVVIVRARDYSMQWVRDGVPIRSSPGVATDLVRITAADRDAYRRDRAANPSGAAPVGRPTSVDGSVTPEAMARMLEAYPDDLFPAYKPPFVERGAFRSPGGQFWVVRSPTTAALQGNRIDVLDSAGRRVRELELPDGRQLIALDRSGIYLAHENADGLQYLERYAWPQGLR